MSTYFPTITSIICNVHATAAAIILKATRYILTVFMYLLGMNFVLLGIFSEGGNGLV